MSGDTDIAVGQPEIRKHRRFSLPFSLLVGVLLLWTAAMLRSRSGAIIDRVLPSEIEASQIHMALESYKARFGAFPVGDSPAVFRALRGQNPEHLVFFECPTESVSPDGSLLDPWGTHYKVDFSGNEIIVRSAGPHMKFDTSRDKHFDDYNR